MSEVELNLTPRKSRVVVDGVDIADKVVSLTVEAGVNEPPTVKVVYACHIVSGTADSAVVRHFCGLTDQEVEAP